MPMNNLPIESEQEAAVAILFACLLDNGKTLTESQVDHLSRILVLCSRFRGASLNELTVNAFSLQSEHGSKVVIEHCAPLITEDFKETLFAMACELITYKGSID